MSFSDHFRNPELLESRVLQRFAALLRPKTGAQLETMAGDAERLTRQFFGKTMRLFAPLYLSNECVNNCQYCGFSRDNPILRVTLTWTEVLAEARHLRAQGFRNILLVAGEHPKFVSDYYLVRMRRAPCTPKWPGDLARSRADGNRRIPRRWSRAGADGLVVYQETYDRGIYAEDAHRRAEAGFRLAAGNPERAYAAGFRRLGIGALYGLGRLAARGA